MATEANIEPTSPWDCPVHGPVLEEIMVGFIVSSFLDDVVLGDDENNIHVAERLARVKGMDDFKAVRFVCQTLAQLEDVSQSQ